MDTFSLISYNIHKGVSPFGKNLSIHKLKASLEKEDADLILLQEVQGLNFKKFSKFENWPNESQHEFIADNNFYSVYGKNAIYQHGHHGNAILTKFNISEAKNQDITHLKFEKRGVLHTKVQFRGTEIHCACVHLSLIGSSRKKQFQMIAEAIEKMVPTDAPLIIAGDFNDWSNLGDRYLASKLNLMEVFLTKNGSLAKSFPAKFPVLRLDRVYVRGLSVIDVKVLNGDNWDGISDHVPLKCTLKLL